MADQSTSSIYYAWEDDGDLDAMRHVFAGTVRDFAYDYNANGELTATYASDGSWMWSATSARTVNYDPTNARNEMLSWTDDGQVRSASYDANGNYQGNGVDDFAVHNSANQMLSYTVGTDSAAYRYGPMGRRIETIFNGTTTRFVHAGDMEIAELVQLGGQWKIKTRYIPGPGVDQRVAMITVDTSSGVTISREYFHADRLGSVLAMVSESGAVMANYVYTPYGVEDYGASGNPFRYTGRRWDAAVGLYYYRARYYDPDMGRFLETDPVLYADQMNLYAYVANNPLNGTDPSGMCVTTANEDGSSSRTGICAADPNDAEMVDLIDQQLADPDSRASEIESILVGNGQTGLIHNGPHPDQGESGVVPNSLLDMMNGNGTGFEAWLDLDNPTQYLGVNASTTEAFFNQDRYWSAEIMTMTSAELFEHEIGGHGYQMATGTFPADWSPHLGLIHRPGGVIGGGMFNGAESVDMAAELEAIDYTNRWRQRQPNPRYRLSYRRVR